MIRRTALRRVLLLCLYILLLMPQTKPVIRVENVVASASVDQPIDLNEITLTFPDVEYHPDQFPGLVFRLKTPKTATLIFSSGKMVCTGSKSEQMARKVVRTVVKKPTRGRNQDKKKMPQWRFKILSRL